MVVVKRGCIWAGWLAISWVLAGWWEDLEEGCLGMRRWDVGIGVARGLGAGLDLVRLFAWVTG